MCPSFFVPTTQLWFWLFPAVSKLRNGVSGRIGARARDPCMLMVGLACRDALRRALANDGAAGVGWCGVSLGFGQCSESGCLRWEVGAAGGPGGSSSIEDKKGRYRICTPGPPGHGSEPPEIVAISRSPGARTCECVAIGRVSLCDGCHAEMSPPCQEKWTE